jgi:hypothetical protein
MQRIINLGDFKKLGFASKEELIMNEYFLELKVNGYIKDFITQPEAFQLYDGVKAKFFKTVELKTKTKVIFSKKQYILNPHIYTADFKIIWESKLLGKMLGIFERLSFDKTFLFLPQISKNRNLTSFIEVKPSWDQNNMTRMFSHRTQPWIYEKFGVYVQLIKPYELMKDTFIPNSIRHELYYKKNTKTKKVGDKKFGWEYKTLEKYLNNNHGN